MPLINFTKDEVTVLKMIDAGEPLGKPQLEQLEALAKKVAPEDAHGANTVFRSNARNVTQKLKRVAPETTVSVTIAPSTIKVVTREGEQDLDSANVKNLLERAILAANTELTAIAKNQPIETQLQLAKKELEHLKENQKDIHANWLAADELTKKMTKEGYITLEGTLTDKGKSLDAEVQKQKLEEWNKAIRDLGILAGQLQGNKADIEAVSAEIVSFQAQVAASKATQLPPVTHSKPTSVVVPQANANVSYNFDQEKNITKKGVDLTGATMTIAPAVGASAIATEKQTEIQQLISKIEAKNFEKYITKSQDYKMEGGEIKKKDGSTISDDELTQIRADYMKEGRTNASLNETAAEVLKETGKNYKFSFKVDPPTPAPPIDVVITAPDPAAAITKTH